MSRLIRWVPELLTFVTKHRARKQIRVIGAAILVGVVAGLAAIAFYVATAVASHTALAELVGYRPEPRPGGEPALPWLDDTMHAFRPWLLPLVVTAGGLVSGVLVFALAPEAEGHGTDAVVAAYHEHDGRIRVRVPLVKLIASAITLGSGGSGGREGPIAQIGAGFGSLLASALRFGAPERRVLCAAGMGAGIAAIFRAPLAGALFASEVLYFSPEFEPEVIIPAGIASVVSYCVFGAAFGWRPLFATPELRFEDPRQLMPYLGLAVLMIVLAAVYTRTFYFVTALFHRLRWRRSFRPALGALLASLVALVAYGALGDVRVLGVMSFGYEALQGAIGGAAGMSAGLLFAIAVGKILTTSLTIGSGGSGGVFGPSMVIGGCSGGAYALVIQRFWPELVPDPASFVVVGMAGFFAAAAKTPFSTILIVCEMTGGYDLLLPALWVCVLSFVFSDERSLYSSQLETRAMSPAHRGALARPHVESRVGEHLITTEAIPVLAPGSPLDDVIERVILSRLDVLPVAEPAGKLIGIVTLGDVLALSQEDERESFTAGDLVRTDVAPLSLSDPIDVAMRAFAESDVLALPVVDDSDAGRLVGMVKRLDVSSAYLRALHGPDASPRVPRAHARGAPVARARHS